MSSNCSASRPANRVWSRRTLSALILAAATTARCTPPPAPTPPPTDAPRISCPASQTVSSPNGQSVNVTYASPMISGGSSPVTFKCAPPSASSFALGPTTVMCGVTDSLGRSDSCTFTVTVAPPIVVPPRVNATTFVCFGDSMTEGLNPLVLPRFIPNPPGSYPADLQALLSGRYTAQTVAVLDEGIGGEGVAAGLQRLPSVLSSDRPDLVLLLEGVNDLNGGGTKATPAVVSGLRSMVRLAHDRGVTVFLATLPPERAGASRAFAPEAIEPTNVQIRAMASTEGVFLVDLYRDFNGEVDVLLGADGLHPNAAGYRRMAESFFAAIRATLEEPGPAHARLRALHGR